MVPDERLTPFGCREEIFVSGGGCAVRTLSPTRPLLTSWQSATCAGLYGGIDLLITVVASNPRIHHEVEVRKDLTRGGGGGSSPSKPERARPGAGRTTPCGAGGRGSSHPATRGRASLQTTGGRGGSRRGRVRLRASGARPRSRPRPQPWRRPQPRLVVTHGLGHDLSVGLVHDLGCERPWPRR